MVMTLTNLLKETGRAINRVLADVRSEDLSIPLINAILAKTGLSNEKNRRPDVGCAQ